MNKESAVWKTVSTFPANQLQKNDRRVGSSWGGHFLCVKIFHAISNMPKPTVASKVSRAKISNSVMKHHPLRIRASGARQKHSPPRRSGRKGFDRLPYIDSTLKSQYTRRSDCFQQAETSFVLEEWTAAHKKGILDSNRFLHRRRLYRGKLQRTFEKIR